MDFLIEHWYTILLVIVFLVGGTISVLRFTKLSAAERYDKIRGWLLQAVMLAEREFGSGTGKLKLSAVYDKFCERFPWFAKIITFELFSKYVDDALDEMRSILQKNEAIAQIVEGE